MASIFISHSSQDKRTARKIARDLERIGHEVWLDEWKILVGQCIQTEIEKGIEEADFVVLLLSSHAVQSKWVEREWRTAHWNEINSQEIFILPVLIEKSSIPTLIQTKKYADFTKSYGFGFHALATAIDEHSPVNDLDRNDLGMNLQHVGLSEVFANRDAYFRSYPFKYIVKNAPAGSTIWFFSVTAFNISLLDRIVEQAMEKDLHLRIAVIHKELAPELDVLIDDLNGSFKRWREIVQRIRQSGTKTGSIEIREYSQLCFDQCCIFEDGNVWKLAYVWRFGQGQYDKSVFLFSASSKDSLYHKLKERFLKVYDSGNTLLEHPARSDK